MHWLFLQFSSWVLLLPYNLFNVKVSQI
jgi:hypothetical protein